jgi:DNA-binding NtrC family response regulator
MEQRQTVLVVDDEAAVLKILKRLLETMGLEVLAAEDGISALELLRSRDPAVVLTDLVMPGIDGMELLRQAKVLRPDVTVVMVTGQGSIPAAVDAIKAGAFDFIEKPVLLEPLGIVVGKALERNRLIRENRDLRARLEERYQFASIIGGSEPMREIYRTIEKVAPTEASVLISGESGTGKEMVARAVHAHSLRRDRAFVAVDCVSLPVPLVESELFGHEKGAFTGATATQVGLLEVAQGGTFFLDELTETSVELQAKLLRVLQERQFRRVGGREWLPLDIRVLAATKRDPLQAVADGRLREDLFYRLNVVPVRLPPLRERRQDIPLLVRQFLSTAQAQGGLGRVMTPEALDALLAYDWPGNVRELRNMVERLSILARGEEITVADLPAAIRGKTVVAEQLDDRLADLAFAAAKQRALERFQRQYLDRVLERHGGNVSKAAAASGVSRKTLHRFIAKYGANRGEPPDPVSG